MKQLCVLGIDPGLKGALAFMLTERPNMIAAEDMPVAAGKADAAGVAELLRIYKPDVACLEYVASRPGQGVSSSFNFGMSFGVVKGVVIAFGIPLHIVTPTVWKKHFSLSSDKEKSRELALRMWPSCAGLFARKKDENRAEAALLARWYAEKNIFQGPLPIESEIKVFEGVRQLRAIANGRLA